MLIVSLKTEIGLGSSVMVSITNGPDLLAGEVHMTSPKGDRRVFSNLQFSSCSKYGRYLGTNGIGAISMISKTGFSFPSIFSSHC